MFVIQLIKSWFNPEKAKAIILSQAKATNLALAEFVAERARLYCPYDFSKRAGELHLRDTIQVVSESNGMAHHVIATAPWAEPVEFGYTHYRSGRRIPPVGYLRRAVMDGKKEYPRISRGSQVNKGYHSNRVMGVTFSAS